MRVLPLLDLVDAHRNGRYDAVLCDQLEAMGGEPGERYMRSCARSARRSRRGRRGAGERRRARWRRRCPRACDYTGAERAFEGRGRDLIAAFARSSGWSLDLRGTHALLPMIATDAGLRLQLATGTASHMRRFGHCPAASGCRSARTFPLERELRRRRGGVLSTNRGEGFDHLLPVATEAGRWPSPIDWRRPARLTHERLPGASAYRKLLGAHRYDLRPWARGRALRPRRGACTRPRARPRLRDPVAGRLRDGARLLRA